MWVHRGYANGYGVPSSSKCQSAGARSTVISDQLIFVASSHVPAWPELQDGPKIEATFSSAKISSLSTCRPVDTAFIARAWPLLSRCALVLCSMYSLRSSLRSSLALSCFRTVSCNVTSFGRSSARSARSAGSWESAKVVFVVSGCWGPLGKILKARAEGESVRKERPGCALAEPWEAADELPPEAMVLSCTSTASFRLYSFRSALETAWEAATLRRRSWTDSAVGALVGVGYDRFWPCQHILLRFRHFSIHLVVLQANPFCQVARYWQYVP